MNDYYRFKEYDSNEYKIIYENYNGNQSAKVLVLIISKFKFFNNLNYLQF
jgi:hypothetical protein